MKTNDNEDERVGTLEMMIEETNIAARGIDKGDGEGKVEEK